jgi:hypothetical protein
MMLLEAYEYLYSYIRRNNYNTVMYKKKSLTIFIFTGQPLFLFLLLVTNMHFDIADLVTTVLVQIQVLCVFSPVDW